MVFCYQNCSDLLWEKNVIVIEKSFETTRTIYSSSERSEQFLITECFFNLFREVSETIRIQKGKKKYWDLETCRKSEKKTRNRQTVVCTKVLKSPEKPSKAKARIFNLWHLVRWRSATTLQLLSVPKHLGSY